jgi:hypothetical protein
MAAFGSNGIWTGLVWQSLQAGALVEEGLKKGDGAKQGSD